MRLLFLLVPVLLLIAVACGGPAETPEPPKATETAATSAPTAAPTPEPTAMEQMSDPESGGTLVRLWSDPPTLDPHLAGDTTSAGIIVEVFGGLTTIDGQLEIVPDLAETWDISDGGLTYTFTLRDDIEFHDGRAVTADDVKWSMERATDPATEAPTVSVFLGDIAGVNDKLEGNASNISGVKVIDQRTISVTADAPKAYLLAKLSYPTSYTLDRNNLEASDDWFKQPNGTGPFLLDEYIPGELIRLTANKSYHLGAPHVDEVMHILSGGDALLMYENDEIHVTGVGLTSLDAILDPANPLSTDVQRSPPSFSTYFMGLNAIEPPFDDKNVRLALNYAIDRDTISETLLRGLLVPANGVLPPGFPGYDPNLGGYEYDPEKAKRLLAESKYGSNMEDFPHIILSLPGSFGASVGPSTEAILAMWQETLGIEVEVLQTEWATYLQDQHEGRFQMYGGSGWVADYPDPENFLDVLLHSKSVDNHTNYANPEVDDLLERARTEQDQAKRFDLYNRAEKLIVADAPWIPLWHGDSGYVLIKPYVKDYFLFPMVIPRLRHVQIKEN